MQIAIDATYSLGSELTGVGIYSREMLHGLAELHPEARFFHYFRPHRFLRSFSERLPGNCRRRILLDRFSQAKDIFHGLNQRLPAQVRAGKSVTTFHDLFVLTGDYSSPDFRARFAAQARDAARRTDLIISVSQFTADQVSTLLNVEPARIRVIHHGVQMPEERPTRRYKVILHVGAIQLRKNIGRLVQAFETVPTDWVLVLAGSVGYGGEEIVRRIEDSRARDRIKITGYLPAKDLDSLYATSSLFAFPSLDEGFGMPVLEAMAHGLPVLTSNRSALPEVCGDAALLVDPTDVDAIGAALNTLIRDSDLRGRLIEGGLRRATASPWEAAVRKTWDVYEEALRL